MIIRTAKKQNRFSIVDNTGFNDPRLSYKAKGLLGYFLTKPDDWQVRMEDLLKHGRDGLDGIKAGMKELRLAGYATLETGRDKQGHLTGKEWVIHESPITGKPLSRSTDSGLFRQSGNPDNRETPIIGKIPPLLNTEDVVNTDVVDNTDFTRTSAEKSNFDAEKAKKAPPVPAVPPVLFSDSEFAGRFDRFETQFQIRFPDVVPDTVDLQHYFKRCTRWSHNRGAVSTDWIQFAADIINDDRQKGKLITPKPLHDANSGSNSPNQSGPGQSSANPAGFDRDAIAASARRVVEGYSRKNRV